MYRCMYIYIYTHLYIGHGHRLGRPQVSGGLRRPSVV